MNRTFKTVALPILVVFVLVYVAQSMFHFGGSGTPTKKAGWGSLVATANSDPKSIAVGQVQPEQRQGQLGAGQRHQVLGGVPAHG